MSLFRLLTIDPGHFHAALIQKTMLPGVQPTAHVYAPLGPDLLAHLGRIASFNARTEAPTSWHLEVHAGDDFLERAWREKPGDVVVLAGRNRDKIRRIHAALSAGLHVLADKPWVLVPEDLPLLAECVRLARASRLVATDVLTERYEITSILQRDLLRDPEVVGDIDPGTPDDPAVVLESVHGLIKTVAGSPLRRPAWFFDLDEQGEALTDVGVHLIDLVQWTLRPHRGVRLDEIAVLDASRRHIRLTRDDFERITGSRDFPAFTDAYRDGDVLLYPALHRVDYTLGGVHVRVEAAWHRECPHGDTHYARFRCRRANVVILQDASTGHRPAVWVLPANLGDDPGPLARPLEDFVTRWRPGAGVQLVGPTATDPSYRFLLPESLRVGHEEHFAQVAQQFLGDLLAPELVPAWEDAYTCARYHVSTHGVALARRKAAARPA